MLNLDTHIVVSVLDGSLSPDETALVSAEPLGISSIVLWELAKLVQLRRLVLDFDSREFQTFMTHVTIFPITLQIARQSTKLDFRADPVDEIIAATSIIEQIPLLTRDRKLLKSRMTPLAFRRLISACSQKWERAVADRPSS
jgi:PIN domain nuclease of toxin-antitoxin system